MYSLYRAWLSLGPCENLPSLAILPTQSPLNLTTPNNIPGAPDVGLQVGPNLVQFSAHKAVLSAHSGFFKAALINHTATSPIVVPNVNVDEFSSLLTFMYTGFLDLNISNIYNILLATHILHMPKALEICRNFLLHSQNNEILQRSNSNVIKPIPSKKTMLVTPQIFAPNNNFISLQKSEDTLFKTVENVNKNDIYKASTSKIESLDEMEVEKTSAENLTKKNVEKSKQKKQKTESSSSSSNEKVIIDIACCDGPVRFHRVVNKYYGVQITENSFEIQKEVNRNAVMNKVMSENIQNKMDDEENNMTEQNNEIFTCLYCNHTFKSQYCFQKHARRHLNPVSLEAKTVPKETVNKREVKLLDMNVQYYPCKTCGSKFPSYYFVHKHRKLCHPEEMADNTNKNNEMVPESNTADDSNSSAIDVVAISNENH